MTRTNTLGIRNGNQIIPYAAGSPMPAGTIVSFAGSAAPTGWSLCDGSELSTTTYAQLYARIGTTWNTCTNPLTGVANSAPSGGNFRLPDLRGTFLRGVGDFTDDTKDTVLAGFQSDKMVDHKHSLALYNTVGSLAATDGAVRGYTFSDGNFRTGASVLGSNGTYGSGTANDSTETRPQNVGVKYIIKY